MNVIDALQQRISANKYDSSEVLSAGDIHYLVSAALEAPSAYNIQHTRFLAVTDAEAKAALRAVSYNQAKISEAAATFIVLADLQGHTVLPLIAQRGVAAGVFSEEAAQGMVKAANGVYEGNGVMQRDEAIRSASLAAMALMLAAQEKGWASGPMIGFEPQKLAALFGLSERYLPVMLVTVGTPAAGNWPRKPRLRSEEVAIVDARPGQDVQFSAA
jgi:nitroreductase